MAQYGRAQYWDDRYTRDPEPFDWYQRWDGLKDVLTDVLAPEANVLVIGCGNSRLSEELYDEGYTNITNVDISQVVINAMTAKYADRSTMKYLQMDCKTLDFPADKFNVVLDKGTLDSILCGEGSTHNIHTCLSEISRVLTANGVFVCVSHGEPSYRLTYLRCPEFSWNVMVQTVTKPMMGLVSTMEEQSNVHYIYVCVKGDPFVKWEDPKKEVID